MSDKKQVKEAENHVNQAAKAEKKSFFHKPDPGDAASHYQKAAEIYLKQNMYQEAKVCYERAAINFDHDGQSLSSGSCYGLAAKAAFLKKDAQEILRLCQECKVQYFEGGNGLPAVRVIKEYAQKLREVKPEVSYQLYDNLLEIIETEEKYHWEKDSFVDFALLCYDMKKYDECYKAWDRAKKAFLHLNNTDGASHCWLSAIVISLERNDIVKAKNLYDEAMQESYFVKTQDFNCADMIYRGVKNHDGDLLEIGQKNIILGFIKPEIARIIDSFKAPKSEPVEEQTKKQPVKPTGGPSKAAKEIAAEADKLAAAEEAKEEKNDENNESDDNKDDENKEDESGNEGKEEEEKKENNDDEDWLL